MSEKLVVPPVGMAVSIEAARRAARTSGSRLDAELEEKVRGITEEAEHITGRAFITQTWALSFDHFPAVIKLPHPPIISVEYIKFYDLDGVLQELHPDDYEVDPAVDSAGTIVPAPGTRWPDTQLRKRAVEVQYVCGYGPDDSGVPPAIKQYITGMVENHYYPNPNADHLEHKLDRAMVY